MIERRVLQLLDGCPLNRAELEEGELTELADILETRPEIRARVAQVQHLDQLIAAACRDVRIPAGLQSRILKHLGQVTNSSAAHFSSAQSVVDDTNVLTGNLKSRGWNSVCSLVVVTTFVFLLIGVWRFYDRPYDREQLLQMALKWSGELNGDNHWNQSLSTAPVDDYPIDHRVLVRPSAWRNVHTEIDGQAVAYALQVQFPDETATLFVLRSRRRIRDLPTAPPTSPRVESNCLTSAWSSGDQVYVLVLKGRRNRYHNFVRTTTTIATIIGRRSLQPA